MTCEKCKSNVVRMVFTDSGWGCDYCLQPTGQSYGSTVIRGENKYAPNLTHNEIMHIKTRHIGVDGKVHAAPRYETKDH